MVDTIDQLRRLVLSAVELRELTEWPGAMIEDYLNILDDVLTLASAIDINTQEIDVVKKRAYFYGRVY